MKGLLAVLATVVTLAAPVTAHAQETPSSDPLESVNRVVFKFNDAVDTYFLAPVARGYRFVAPQPVRKGVGNFFTNLRSPVVIANDLLQLKFQSAVNNFGRFFINTGMGLGGFVNITACDTCERHDEDFGQTLGVYGVPTGPYLVLPFLGPSTLRDFAGGFPDYYLAVWPPELNPDEVAAVRVTDTIQWRAGVLEEVEDAKEGSLDYYSFLRNAYLQRRAAQIRDNEVAPSETQDDLYYFDE